MINGITPSSKLFTEVHIRLNHSSLISWSQDDSFHAQFKWKWKVFARINLGACQLDKGVFIWKCHCYLEQHERVYKLLIYLKSNNTWLQTDSQTVQCAPTGHLLLFTSVKIQDVCCSIGAVPTDLLQWKWRSASYIIANGSFQPSALLSWD